MRRGGALQTEHLRDAIEQFALRRVLRDAPAELLARVLHRHLDDLALLAALRHG